MSKNTRYFDTLEEAQQYYGGNVVPSTEIALVGDGSYVFVSSDNAKSGNQQYFDASMTNDEIVSTMTYTAYNEGFAYGETVTYPVAYAAGEAYGYAQGYEGGYSYGYDEGYTEGEAQGGVSLTEEQLNQMSFGLTMQTIRQAGIDIPYLWQVDSDYLDTALVTDTMSSPTGMLVDVYNETDGLVEYYNFTFIADDINNNIIVSISLAAGDKVGFTLYPVTTDAGTGDNVLDSPAAWLYRYVDPDNDGNGYNTHFYEAENSSDYLFVIQLQTDQETGDLVLDGCYFFEDQGQR